MPEVTQDRPRVSAVVLRDAGADVLMVQHQRRDGTTYWQLPGGGVIEHESLEAAVLRELYEETKLAGTIVRFLFTIPYKYGLSTTFLIEIDPGGSPSLGADPEEVAADHRKLIGVAWMPIADVRDNPEVSALLRVL